MRRLIVLLGIAGFAPLLAQTDYETFAAFETREYISDNGRRIRITSLGSLIGLETPTGFDHMMGVRTSPREGYVVAYQDPRNGITRVLHDVNDRWSMYISPPQRDFMPVSFIGPVSGTRFVFGTAVVATVTVETLDHVLRLKHVFRWTAGIGLVSVTTTIQNLLTLSVPLISFKRHGDQDVDGRGAYTPAPTGINLMKKSGSSVIIEGGRCIPAYCPPPPWATITEDLAAMHTMTLSGSPTPAVTAKLASNDAELLSAYLVTSGERLGLNLRENDQATLVWYVNVLMAPLATKSYTAKIQVD